MNGNPKGTCLFFCLALTLAVMLGCGPSGPKTTRVHGKVSYKGAPVTEGTVNFVPKGAGVKAAARPAVASLKADGTYELSSFGKADGALAGEYQVAIISKTGGPTPEEPNAKEVWAIPKKFADVTEGGLTATVPDKGGDVEINFDLKD